MIENTLYVILHNSLTSILTLRNSQEIFIGRIVNLSVDVHQDIVETSLSKINFSISSLRSETLTKNKLLYFIIMDLNANPNTSAKV